LNQYGDYIIFVRMQKLVSYQLELRLVNVETPNRFQVHCS